MVESETMTVGHPVRVNVVVLPGCDAEDFIGTCPNRGVAARAAIEIDTFGLFQEPNAHLEAKIIGGEGSDRADVSGIQCVVII